MQFELNGVQFAAVIERDDTSGAPWNECDGHGIVSDWTTRDKKAGELILASNGRLRRFYDFAESVKIAKRDGWNAPPYDQGTRAERATRAVWADFKRLRAWCGGDWQYVGVIVRRDDSCECCGKSASLWGIESDSDLESVARELAGELI